MRFTSITRLANQIRRTFEMPGAGISQSALIFVNVEELCTLPTPGFSRRHPLVSVAFSRSRQNHLEQIGQTLGSCHIWTFRSPT